MTLGSESICKSPIADETDYGAFATPGPLRYWTCHDSTDRWPESHHADQKVERQLSSLSRVVDIVGAAVILLIAFPFLVLLSLALKFDSHGPLLFVQRRIGLNGREFSCLKFRTMCSDAETALQLHLLKCAVARSEWARDHKLRDDPRITRLGGIVRKLSLDEFPQLINILRGDMSLVGPRPIVRAEVLRYGRYFQEYCRVKPGLTGLWQVSGRNDVSYRRRVSIDCYYVRNKTLAFDMMILFRTIPVVLWAKGSY